MSTDDNMSAAEWTQKQIKLAFAPLKSRKVKAKLVKKPVSGTESHLHRAIEAWRMKD